MKDRVLGIALSAGIAISCTSGEHPSGTQNPNPSKLSASKDIPTRIIPSRSPESTALFVLAQSWSGFADMKSDSSNSKEGDIINITLEKDLSIQRMPYLQRTIDDKGLVKVLGTINDKQAWFVIKVDLPESKQPKTPLEIFAESIPVKEGLMTLPKGEILSLQFRNFQLSTAQGLPPDVLPAYELRIPPIPPKTP